MTTLLTPDADGRDAAPPAPEPLEHRLLQAWLAGDRAARDAAWEEVWAALYTAACRFCISFCRDEDMAREWAMTAVNDAWLDINRLLDKGERPKAGAGQFVGWIMARVVFQCRRQCRAAFVAKTRFRDIMMWDGEEREDALGSAGAVGPAQEDDLIGGERDREGVRHIIRLLAGVREHCRARPSELEVVELMQAYLRECLVAALPPGIDGTHMTLDDLADAARLGHIEATKSAMYQLIMTRLQINRNALYLRIGRIRRLVED